jgi:hypothetical protein
VLPTPHSAAARRADVWATSGPRPGPVTGGVGPFDHERKKAEPAEPGDATETGSADREPAEPSAADHVMSAAADWLDTRDAYNDAADKVQELKDRIERASRDPQTTPATRAELTAEFRQAVEVAVPLQERLHSARLIAHAVADFPRVEVPAEPEPVEGAGVRPPAWGESHGRTAQLERERRDR